MWTAGVRRQASRDSGGRGPSRADLRSARPDGRPPPGSDRPRRRPSPHRGAAAPATPGPGGAHANSPTPGRPRRSPAPGPAHAGGAPSPGRQPSRTEPGAPSAPQRPADRSLQPRTRPTHQYRNVTNHRCPPPVIHPAGNEADGPPAPRRPAGWHRRLARYRNVTKPKGSRQSHPSPEPGDGTRHPPETPTTRPSPAPLDPPVTQRDIEAEVANCVGGVITPPWGVPSSVGANPSSPITPCTVPELHTGPVTWEFARHGDMG